MKFILFVVIVEVVGFFLVTGFPTEGPCDIYDSANTPCVAAHSTVRALYRQYNGPLYQVKRTNDNATLDVGVLFPGGPANSKAQDNFCGRFECVIQRIYDQSSKGNHLSTAPAGGAVRHPDRGVNATRDKQMIGGYPVYGAFFEGDMGYRNDYTSGIAKRDEPESLYMVVNGRHYNGGCCFDYGNAETNNDDDGAGTMEAIYWGNCGVWGRGSGDGPWVMADLENGLWAGNEKYNPNNKPVIANYVTAMVKGRSGGFTLKGGNAQSGRLSTLFDGERPNGYNPMKKQGAIILGIGGDNSNGAVGTFYEGVMTSGYSSDTTDDAVQANIIEAGYGH
eukprot:TRINITY_DN304_c0_g1_i1.p1 TRINITY_DN304_c0_g1~~TRINITY_DN304_c0_g1_i1.p1  ORF type:complete len:335 (+),score=73.11 TRINITY_DN304_c0_g1_i1:66-1070(+)